VAGYLKAVNLNCATVPISSLMVEKGFNARAAYKERMKTDQENKVNEAAIAERKRHLDEQVSVVGNEIYMHSLNSFPDFQLKDEMERSVKRQKLMEAEKAVLDKKSQLVVEENAARSMIEEYQKKMALIAEQRKEVDQQEKKLASQKKAEDSKILQLTLAKAAK
jgi:outer membrane cobalamin receptor